MVIMTAQEWNHPNAPFFLESHVEAFIFWKNVILRNATKTPQYSWEIAPLTESFKFSTPWPVLSSLAKLRYLKVTEGLIGPQWTLNNS